MIILWLTLAIFNKWFGFRTCWPDEKYDWEDEKCYQKCMNWCSYENCQLINASICNNDCVAMCEIPRYENCMSKCEDLKIDWYDRQHYNEWLWSNVEDDVKESNGIELSKMVGNSFSDEYKYNERIDEVFSWYKGEIEEYEFCLSSCWKKPTIIR